MERRVWIVAVAAALAGAGLLRWYVHRLQQEVAGGPSVRALVVTRDVAAGTTLTRDMLGTRDLPQAYLESRHVRARDLDQVLGAALAVPARASEALLWTDLASMREPARAVSSLVPEGMRAVSLARAAGGMDELLAPGDRVDVLLVPERSSVAPIASALRVAENLLVLAVGADSGAASGRPGPREARRNAVVTVSATPEQSLQLAAAERGGALRLVLRNPDDIAITSSPAVQAVAGGSQALPPAATARSVREAQP